MPNDLDGLAKSTGAIKRRRKLTTAEQVPWLSLMHAGLLISLRTTAAISARSGVCELNDTSVRYRLKREGKAKARLYPHPISFRQ